MRAVGNGRSRALNTQWANGEWLTAPVPQNIGAMGCEQRHAVPVVRPRSGVTISELL